MSDLENNGPDEIHSKVLRAGRRTYFFDVRSTKADDYYLTITESKKHTKPNGDFYFKKHKIYLYKEDFQNFKEMLDEATQFIINERGDEVISERHEPDFQKKQEASYQDKGHEEFTNSEQNVEEKSTAFTDVNFEDI